MSDDIDWVVVIVNSPLTNYLDKYVALALSLVNKRIRAKLYSVIFSDLNINPDGFLSHSNYFGRKKYIQFGNLTWIKRFKLARKYGSNKDLAFKKIQIDPFIAEANTTLSSASVHCKSLTLYNLDRPCYFLFPVFNNFIYLRKLSLSWCEIPNSSYKDLLTKLESLEILNIESINLILTKSEDPDLAKNLKLPVSLKELTFTLVYLGITDSYQLRPREIIRNPKLGYYTENLEIMPQVLPNLKYFKFYEYGQGTGKIEEFMALNPNVEYENDL